MCEAEKQGRSAYICKYTDTPVAVDGNVEKPVWKKAEPVTFYIPVTGEQPLSKTEAGLLWDENYLYVYLKAFDKDVFSYQTERDSRTCEDDVLEVFFKTDPEKEPYYNFEINALNTVYDAYNIRRGAAGSHYRWSKWNCEGLKSATAVKGTINNPSDIDEYWVLEMAIPFAELDLGGKVCPDAGDIWTILLSRYDYSVYLPDGLEYSASAKLTQINYHRYEDWDRMVFMR